MKKSLLILAAVFTFSSFFTSCRENETRTEEVEVSDDLDNTEEEIEDAAEDVGNSIEEGANEVEQELEGNDDV